MAKNKTSSFVWVRRLSQTAFLLLFLYLFVLTAYHPGNETSGPVTLFFNMDPLLLFTVWLGGHAVASAFLLSFITLGLTLIFGRWFCGWVCPLGTLQHLVSWVAAPRKRRRFDVNRYRPWFALKYVVLTVLLTLAAAGANHLGWLDPIVSYEAVYSFYAMFDGDAAV